MRRRRDAARLPACDPDGFPTGVFEKTFDDPDFGPVRLSWVFEANGDWAEVPEATAGQTTPRPGRRAATTPSTATSCRSRSTSPSSSTHQHHWRLDGDRLITTYDDSDLPEDADFFAMLDRQPWVRVP